MLRPHLVEHVGTVYFHRARADRQLLADQPVGQADCDAGQHFQLAPGQLLHPAARPGLAQSQTADPGRIRIDRFQHRPDLRCAGRPFEIIDRTIHDRADHLLGARPFGKGDYRQPLAVGGHVLDKLGDVVIGVLGHDDPGPRPGQLDLAGVLERFDMDAAAGKLVRQRCTAAHVAVDQDQTAIDIHGNSLAVNV